MFHLNPRIVYKSLASLVILAAWPSPSRADFQIFSQAGPDQASITATVDAYRDALGPLNAPEPAAGPNQPGRRQINWDAAPDAVSDPNPFPGDFFNADVSPRARGIEFSTDGAGFLLSANPDPGEAADPFGLGSRGIRPFSDFRMFSAVGSTTTYVDFFTPADNSQRGLTHGLGVIFNDVEVEGSTSISLYDIDGNLLIREDVEVSGDAGFSFLGFLADDGPIIARAVIDSGDNVLVGSGQLDSDLLDFVAMDDFIFGEAVAVPEPTSLALVGLGLAGILGVVRARRTASKCD